VACFFFVFFLFLQVRLKLDFWNFLQDVDVTDNPVLLAVMEQNPSLKVQTHFYLHQKLEPVTYKDITPAQMASTFLHVRLKGELLLNAEPTSSAIAEAFQNLHKKVSDVN